MLDLFEQQDVMVADDRALIACARRHPVSSLERIKEERKLGWCVQEFVDGCLYDSWIGLGCKTHVR